MIKFCSKAGAQSRRKFLSTNNAANCGSDTTSMDPVACKNPDLLHLVSESEGNLAHVPFSEQRLQKAPCHIHCAGFGCARRLVAGFSCVAASACPRF